MARECGTACPTTCDNYNTTIICTEQCVPGCFCPQGTVELFGVCVDPSQCTNSMYLQYMASLTKWWLLEATCMVYIRQKKCNKCSVAAPISAAYRAPRTALIPRVRRTLMLSLKVCRLVKRCNPWIVALFRGLRRFSRENAPQIAARWQKLRSV